MLQVLYKLKTAKVFERARGKDEKPAEIVEEDPFAIQTLWWCPESRMLCVAGVSAHVIVYRFSKQDVTTEVQVRLTGPLASEPAGSAFSDSGPDLPRDAAGQLHLVYKLTCSEQLPDSI